MTRDELLAAPKGIVAMIRQQAETRLANQCAFADAQDGRAGSLVGSAVALAAAAVAVVSGAAAIRGVMDPLTMGAGMGVLGFTLASSIALWATRSVGFHSVGWYPEDFADDLATAKAAHAIEADMVLALQCRLSENRTILDDRGRTIDVAAYILLGTPIMALIAAVATSLLGL